MGLDAVRIYEERKREGEEWWCIGGEHAQRHKQGREAWGIFNKIFTGE